MFSFERPLFLALALLVPLFYALRRSGSLARLEFPLTLGDWDGIPFKWSSPLVRFASFFHRALALAGFLAVVVALAGPVRFRQEEVYSKPGSGVVFALDVSPSMAARDIAGETRIDAARAYIRAFAAKRPGDSLGLVALGRDAALLVPPTQDHRAFLERLDALAIGELGDGTALGLGLAVAAAHLVGRDVGRASVILMTDGENNTGEINPKTAAGIYPENGIGLFVVGVGSTGEVPIEYTDPSTGKRYSGTLNSRFDEGALKEIAIKARGTYLTASNKDALDAVFASIDESVPASASSWSRTVADPLETPIIVAALALFALAWLVSRVFLRSAL
jgi:Ca-activated chloride channel family protein